MTINFKKFIALIGSVVILITTPIGLTKAEAANSNSKTSNTQGLKSEKAMTFDDFMNLYNAYIEEYKRAFGKTYRGIEQDAYLKVFVKNIPFIYGTPLEGQLIDNSLIYVTDLRLVDTGETYPEAFDEDGYANFDQLLRLINEVNINHNNNIWMTGEGKIAVKHDINASTFDESVCSFSKQDKENDNKARQSYIDFVTATTTYNDSRESNILAAAQKLTDTLLYNDPTNTSSDSINTSTVGAKREDQLDYAFASERIFGFLFDEATKNKTTSAKELAQFLNIKDITNGTYYGLKDNMPIDDKTLESLEGEIASKISNPMIADLVMKYIKICVFAEDRVNIGVYTYCGQQVLTEEEAKQLKGSSK